MQWPIYMKELLTLGNPGSSVGLCTLWTEKEKVLSHISPENYLVAGQCYSKSEGISLMVRHVLANKKLREIVLCGADLNGSGDALLALSRHGVSGPGVDGRRRIVGVDDAFLDSEIPIGAVDRFIKYVRVNDQRHVKNFSELEAVLQNIPHMPSWGEPEVYERAEPVAPEFFPSERTGFVLRGKTVGDVWLKVLDSVLRFGSVKKSQYSDAQKELVGLTTVVTGENPDKIAWKHYFKFTPEHFRNYLPQLMSGEIAGDVNYTYGSRLRNFNGRVNQIDSMVSQLKEAIHSRRAVGVTWDVEKDHNNPHSPCFDLVQALAQDALYLTCYVRSNDMFGAWPENALGFRRIQQEIAERVSVPMGDLVIVSNSAHIYSSKWKEAQEIVDKYNPWGKREPDPRGNILIGIEDSRIKVTHLNPAGERVGEFYAGSAREAQRELSRRQSIGQVSHALDIGVELGKAEYALKKGMVYVQDKPLR